MTTPTGPRDEDLGRRAPTLADLDVAHRTHLALLRDLPDADLAAPSLLPGWSRAHVVAHLANHGIGTRHAVDALQDGRSVPMYSSVESREAGIATVARRSPDQLRDLAEFGAREITGALSTIRPEQRDLTIERVPGTAFGPLGDLVGARIREVYVHTADLGTSYSARDWPAAFLDELLDVLAHDRQVRVRRAGEEASTTVDGVDVSGHAAELAWWLLGRGDGSALRATGDLPALGPWVRRHP
ncbi:maleylpyruvate isomerase family mycothiol-dependent enzyme [Alteromonas gracilis]